MKKIIYILLIVLSLAFVVGCNDSEEDNKIIVDNDGNPDVLPGVVLKDTTVYYNGEEHSILVTNLPSGIIAVYEGNKVSEVGEYLITARLYTTMGELLDELSAKLTILPAKEDSDNGGNQGEDNGGDQGGDNSGSDLTGVSFNGIEVTYDGEEHSITVTNLPSGYVVQYEGNNVSEVGTHTVVAKIYNELNELVLELTATIKIIDKIDVELPLV